VQADHQPILAALFSLRDLNLMANKVEQKYDLFDN
jgi:hypothetical protein